MSSTRRVPRVLITNDDGPPGDSSPFVYPFARALVEQLGWEVRVVVPSSQKSWVGKSYLIAQTTTGVYYYPTGKDGREGERSELPRPLKEGEEMEWVLVDGTPATCSNLGLYSLFPHNTFDLVIAGPNFGRNTSTAFALSSGTIGSAMAASLSGVPSIALSFGLMEGYKPASEELVAGGIKASCQVVQQLWELGWGEGAERVDVFSVNVPLMPTMLAEGGPEVHWTSMARTNYQRLFKSISKAPAPLPDKGGPSAIPEPVDETTTLPAEPEEDVMQLMEEHRTRPLKYVFAPDISSLINPTQSTLQAGTDTHSLHEGHIAVTPIRAAFEPAAMPTGIETTEGFKWRL